MNNALVCTRNILRRTTAVILLCCMVLAVMPAFATAGGIWRCVAVSYQSAPVDITGMERILTLRLNGSGEADFIMEIFYPQEERLNGYWKEKGNEISLNFSGKEKDVKLTIEGDFLYYERGGYVYSLVYDMPANIKYFEGTDIVASFARRDLSSSGTAQTSEEPKPDKLVWGISKKDAKRIVGGQANTNAATRPGMELLSYSGQKISEFTADEMLLSFRNDQLFSRQYVFQNDKQDQIYFYLREALDKLYGASEGNIAVATQYFTLYISADFDNESVERKMRELGAKYRCWQTDDTNILLLHVETDSDNYTLLSYIMLDEDMPEKVYNFDGL